MKARRRQLAAIAAAAAVPLLTAAGFAASAGFAAAPAKSYRLTANLVGRQEVPPVKNLRAATGLFKATLTVAGAKGALAVRLTFRNLSGPALAAHIHIGRPGQSGPVAVPLCGP